MSLRLTALLFLASLRLTACASNAAPSAAGTADIGNAIPDVVYRTEERFIAGVTAAIADVELSDITFDTFDGGSVSLDAATEVQVEGLLNAIPPIDDPAYIRGTNASWLTEDELVLGFVADHGTAWGPSASRPQLP